MKKILVRIFSICLIMIVLGQNLVITNVEASALSLKKDSLDRFLLSESKCKISKINNKIQSILNEKGMFNSEIKGIDDEFINNLSNSNIDDIMVSTEYVLYSMKNNNITTTMLNREEINKIISKYAVNQNQLSESDLNNIMSDNSKMRYAKISKKNYS